MDKLLNKIWTFIDGNKTIFGLVILQLPDAPFIPEDWVSSIQWLGTLLTALGVSHKAQKATKKINGA